MTHAAEELALQLIGVLHFLVPQFELTIFRGEFLGISRLDGAQVLVGETALGYIADDRRDAEPIVKLNGAEADLNGKARAIFALATKPKSGTHGTGRGFRPEFPAMPRMRAADLFGNQHFDGLA